MVATTVAKRHKGAGRKEAIQGLTKPAIRRLAVRGGLGRLSSEMYEANRGVLQAFLEVILHMSIGYTKYNKRKTVQSADVIYALKRIDRKYYGF